MRVKIEGYGMTGEVEMATLEGLGWECAVERFRFLHKRRRKRGRRRR